MTSHATPSAMPIQAPQWTEFLSCPVCFNEFDETARRPISLGCGHTICKTCLSLLHRRQCPFDQLPIVQSIEELPANYAILQLVGAEVARENERLPMSIVNGYLRHYAAAKSCVEDIAWYLKPLSKGESASGSSSSSSSSSSAGCILSKPMQRKLVGLVNCQLVEDEGRSRAMRAARSLGERTITELILQHQNQQQLSANLWAAVRARGCQFLGPAMQEETLKLVLLVLEDGASLCRKVLVMFVVQKLEQQFPQASKTSVGHVVQLLYRASCFKVTKRDEESSLMQLKEEFRNYDALRKEHDAQIVQIAMEAGLRISPEQWSSLLYGDLNHKSHMQSIIDKLQTPASFAASIHELTIAIQRSGDPGNLGRLRIHLEELAEIDPNPDAGVPSWSEFEQAMVAVKSVVQGLVNYLQNHSVGKKALEQQQTQNIKYKTSMCRDITQKGGCPRGPNCTFAHSEEELERYRAKSRRMLSVINRQINSQTKTSERPKGGDKLIAKGVGPVVDGLSKEERKELRELQQHVTPTPNKQEGTRHTPELSRSFSSSSSLEDPAAYRKTDNAYLMERQHLHQPELQYFPQADIAPYTRSDQPRHCGLQHQSVYTSPQQPEQSTSIFELRPIMSAEQIRPRFEETVKKRVPGDVTIISKDDADGLSLPNSYAPYSPLPVRMEINAKLEVASTVESTTLDKAMSLGKLCQRKQEILHQLSGITDDTKKNPWEKTESLTRTVTSLWTVPSSSISKETCTSNEDEMKSYNPWTSQAPFTLVRPVKESNTNYTMTYIKAHIHHMSVEKHPYPTQEQHMGTHELSEFKRMSLEDLQHTLKKVNRQDQQAGSTHYERGQKIQLEMERRVKGQHAIWEDDKNYEMMRYYKSLPTSPPYLGSSMYQQRHDPISKSSHTPFKSTGPIQVSAGPSETNPVTLTQECLLAPSFQTSPNKDLFFKGPNIGWASSTGDDSSSSVWPPMDGQNSHQMVKENNLECQLKCELADVSNQIQNRVLNKNAQDIVLLEQAAHALDPVVPHGPRGSVNTFLNYYQ